MSSSTKKLGVFVGRFNPIHNGHLRTLDALLKEYGEENSLSAIRRARFVRPLRSSVSQRFVQAKAQPASRRRLPAALQHSSLPQAVLTEGSSVDPSF